MKEIAVWKANRIAVDDPAVEDIQINIAYDQPAAMTPGLANDSWYEQASCMEEALYKSLPGGIYDRLCEVMLARIASQLRVSHNRRG